MLFSFLLFITVHIHPIINGVFVIMVCLFQCLFWNSLQFLFLYYSLFVTFIEVIVNNNVFCMFSVFPLWNWIMLCCTVVDKHNGDCDSATNFDHLSSVMVVCFFHFSYPCKHCLLTLLADRLLLLPHRWDSWCEVLKLETPDFFQIVLFSRCIYNAVPNLVRNHLSLLRATELREGGV